jgi:hypothetical protein
MNRVIDLSIYSSVSYEVALKLLGQSRQPFMQAIHDEQQKPNPSAIYQRSTNCKTA